MFGSEGERLQELRQQQARQYAEQLRQQIAAKNSQKPKSPALYSTTTSETYANPTQQLRSQRTNLNTSNTPPTIRQSSSTNSTDRLQKIVLDPLPDFQATSVAPLNLTINSFQPDPTPSLPRQQTYSLASITDTSSFNERLRSLESVIEQQSSLLSKSSEASSRIFTSQYPTIENSMNDLQARVNRFLNTELVQKINPITDTFQSNREYLENENSKTKSNIEDLRELFSELSSSIPPFTTRFNDSIESIKDNSSEVKNDNNRLLDQIDMSLTKILQIENRESTVNDSSSQSVHEFETIDNDTSTSFSVLQQSTNETMTAASSQIAREIKEESDSREQLTTTLHNQVQEVNKNVSENVNRIQSLINELTSSFKGNIQSLNDSISESLNVVQEEDDSIIKDIDDQINSLITNTEENFTIFQNETVSTIEAMRSLVVQTRGFLEEGLSKESKIQNQNKIEINSKFENFDIVVQREMSLQMKRVNEVGESTIKKGTDAFDAATQDSKTQLILIGTNWEKIEKAEKKLNEIEKNFSTASAQVNECVRNLAGNFNELSQKFEKTKNEIDDGFIEVERRTDDLTYNRPVTFSRREELIELERKADEECEARISEVEKQLAAALANLAEISIARAAKKTRPGSGVLKIKRLVEGIDATDEDSAETTSNTESLSVSGEANFGGENDDDEKSEASFKDGAGDAEISRIDFNDGAKYKSDLNVSDDDNEVNVKDEDDKNGVNINDDDGNSKVEDENAKNDDEDIIISSAADVNDKNVDKEKNDKSNDDAIIEEEEEDVDSEKEKSETENEEKSETENEEKSETEDEEKSETEDEEKSETEDEEKSETEDEKDKDEEDSNSTDDDKEKIEEEEEDNSESSDAKDK